MKGWWGFAFKSKGDDRERCTFTISLFGIWRHYALDWCWLKPVIHTQKKHQKEGSYEIEIEREVSFYYIKDEMGSHITGLIGVDDPGWLDNFKFKSWKVYKMFPWTQSTFREHALLNLDQTVFHIMSRDGKLGDGSCEPHSWDYPSHETAKFKFLDGHDGEEIIATVKAERRTWTKGEKSFAWLRYFTKPRVHIDLDLKFDKEVGDRKGSWKGGTVGTGTRFLDGETPSDSVARFCHNEGHTFLGRIYENNRTKVG